MYKVIYLPDAENTIEVMKKIFLVIIVLFFTCPALSPKGSIQTKNIAVIPFQNITGDKEKNWIGAGFGETLTVKLVKAPGIRVIERENLSKILDEIKFQYTGAVDEKTAVEMGKMYGADVLVFGSFQVMGEKLRVSARFVDVETQEVIDTAEVTGNISDIFKLQDEIAFSLLDSLKIVLGEKEKEEVKINPTENINAYEWFSKGYEAVTLKLYDKAIEYYTKAIQINPKYAEAYFNRGECKGIKRLYNEAISDFTNAIYLNPKYAEAYVSRGLTYGTYFGLFDEEIKNYNKAIEIDPEYAVAYYSRGYAYYSKGLKELCISDWKKAADLGSEVARQNLKKFFNIDY